MEIRKTDKAFYENHMKKAEESLATSELAFQNGYWDACVGNCVHAAISASDALCIYFLGQKHAGQRHVEAVQLLRQIDPSDAELPKHMTQFDRLLNMKTGTEYGERRAKRIEAERALEDCQRFVAWAKHKLERAVV